MSNAKAANVAIAKDILSYFLRNPSAADSLAEIARWRLMQEAVQRSVEETRLALNWLIEQGYVVEEPHLSTASLFQLNPERSDDAASFVKEQS